MHHQSHRGHHHFESMSASNGIDEVADRKVIIGEGRQYILTNEAPVIVSNKEVAAAMTMNDLDLANSFPSTFSQMDHTVLQEISKTSPSRMDDQNDLDTENQVSVEYFIRIKENGLNIISLLYFRLCHHCRLSHQSQSCKQPEKHHHHKLSSSSSNSSNIT